MENLAILKEAEGVLSRLNANEKSSDVCYALDSAVEAIRTAIIVLQNDMEK